MHKLTSTLKAIHKNSNKLGIEKETTKGEVYLQLLSRMKNVTATMDILMKLYHHDMKLFGYKYEKRDDGVYAVCEGESHNGMCC